MALICEISDLFVRLVASLTSILISLFLIAHHTILMLLRIKVQNRLQLISKILKRCVSNFALNSSMVKLYYIVRQGISDSWSSTSEE